MDFVFITTSILLGVGLAMDAFSVSIANGLAEPDMSRRRMCLIAGVYAVYQFAMPMIGWLCVRRVVEAFLAFQKFIPWIALILLAAIGGKMVLEGLAKKVSSEVQEESGTGVKISFMTLMVQGIATSIDALSVGFTIADYGTLMACTSALIIGVVTFAICMGGLLFGKKFGEHFSDKATIAGGLILIGIGISILVRSFL